MLERIARGHIPGKPHVVFRSAGGAPYYEECLTRGGFEGPFSMLYHEHRPHEAQPVVSVLQCPPLSSTARSELRRRHFRCLALGAQKSPPLASDTPLLFNEQVVVGFARPSGQDRAYVSNADADRLYFVLQGAGVLRSAFGDLRFGAQEYVYVPKGVIHRFVPEPNVPQAWLWLEARSGFRIPTRYRNAVGQLRMDAPYSHRDFRAPEFTGPVDEGLRLVVVKRNQTFHTFEYPHSPLDVIGFDGAVYPLVFPILAFQPRVGQLHLPPTVHATFEAEGALVCSFVPRLLDFHEAANPCPYPHSSVDMDEVLFYVSSAFTSRRGIASGSLSYHPAGIPHGPHPGAYEAVPEARRTDEIAVMLDTSSALSVSVQALEVEDPGYHGSFAAR